MTRIFLFISLCVVLCHLETKVDGTSLDNLIDESGVSSNADKRIAGRFLNDPYDDPEVNTNASGLIRNKGYPVEDHTVLTADGYLLSVQRIPYGINRNLGARNRDAVLIIHGILADATYWVANSFPHQSLGFVLADNGYDVWLINTRGTFLSKRHVKYTTKQYQFWNFSFEQVAQYDVPATIDYILDTNGRKTLYLVGHSQGATAAFAMLSDLPEYNDKVKLFIALAPVAFLGFTTTAPRVLTPFAEEIAAVVNVITAGEFLPNNNITRAIREEICAVLLPELCVLLRFAVGGVDATQFNTLVRTKTYRKYDYGLLRNLIQYNQPEPPDYDLSSITTPVALFWSVNDKLADPIDVNILRGMLNTIVFDYLIPYPYDHFDFGIALNADQLVYEPILQLLAQFSLT